MPNTESRVIDINVKHVTRVEGHGNIVVRAIDGKIEKSEWQIPEAPRFFEAMVRGRSYEDIQTVVSRICGILFGFTAAVWAAKVIRAVPESAGLEDGMRFAYYATMVLAAVADALLIDELAMGGAFRKTVLQGKSGDYVGKDEDLEEVAVRMQGNPLRFAMTVALCTGLTYFVFNLINRDLDGYYRTVGTHVSTLRDQSPENAEARRQALAALSIQLQPEVVPILVRHLEKGGPDTAWTAWAIGRHEDLPARTRRALVGPLVAAWRDGDDGTRRAAAVALGRFQHQGFADEIQDQVRADLDSPDGVDLRLVYGLAAVQTMSSVDTLIDVLHRGREDAQRMAAYAIAQHRDQRGGRKVVQSLHDRLPTATPAVKCAIVHSLGILQDEASNLPLIDAYEAASPERLTTPCAILRLPMSPDGQQDFKDLFMPGEPFGMKVVMSMGQMRATTAEIRSRVEPFLVSVQGDEHATPATREAARHLANAIREGRDDTTTKTVDEALDEAFRRGGGPRDG